jgi:hypothetical protein
MDKKMWHVCTGKHYLAIKKNKILSSAAKYIELRDTNVISNKPNTRKTSTVSLSY